MEEQKSLDLKAFIRVMETYTPEETLASIKNQLKSFVTSKDKYTMEQLIKYSTLPH